MDSMPVRSGLVFAVQAVVNALSRIPLGKMSDRADKTKLAVWGFLGLSAVLVVLG